MFANTITLTIATVAHVLNRVNQDSGGSEYYYQGATSSIRMKIRHSTDKPDSDSVTMLRHNIYVERIIYATSTTPLYKQSYTATLRGGKYEDPARCSELAAAATDWLDTAGVLSDLSVGIN